MRICFDLPHVFNGQATDLANAYALRSLLDCLIRQNVLYLKLTNARVPRLYQSGVRYDRTKVWDSIPALYARKYGDCKSLTAALVAEYTVRGIKARPVFRFNPKADRGHDYHILVEVPRKNGLDRVQFEDPSRKLGMGAIEVAPFFGGY